ncbi:hypothetical protein DVR12_07205 [Chitinophaga silvatica]|uniref:Uncharacterized protein n=1 Tax=Chitinophaga silvatica TaxID=2282649 RepID=A0A3E1YEM1_9BACT|nr:hypothetical protein DVR12_07205 [Chitinophaga silvatica]
MITYTQPTAYRILLTCSFIFILFLLFCLYVVCTDLVFNLHNNNLDYGITSAFLISSAVVIYYLDRIFLKVNANGNIIQISTLFSYREYKIHGIEG